MSQASSHYYAEVNGGADTNIKNECRFNPKITAASIISFCLNIVLITIVIIFEQKVTSNDRSRSSVARPAVKLIEDSVCVECGLLGLSAEQVSSRRNGWLLSAGQATLCCLGEAWGLWRLLYLFGMKMRINQLNGSTKTTRLPMPSAHLYLDSLADNFKWTDEYGFGAAHIIKPIKFVNNSYHIEQPGFYNIYSFITLKRRTDVSRSTVIIHAIQLKGNCTGVALQKSVDLPCQSESFATSYLSGVVQLKSQDEIAVYVSDRSAVYRFAPSNFFGLHLVQTI